MTNSGEKRRATPHPISFFALAGLFSLLTGCLASIATIPHPVVVYAPHPARADAGEEFSALFEQYTVSPNRDPDGLGVLPLVWLQSQMTLIVPALAVKKEEAQAFMYARTSEEQKEISRKQKSFYSGRVVFQGMLISDFSNTVDPQFYLPEGIYLLDDKGRKFLPEKVTAGDARFYNQFTTFEAMARVPGELRTPKVSFPSIVFPGEAITKQTRAIRLYFAAFQRRIAFTWIFDETYVPEGALFAPKADSGLNRMFRTQ